MTEPHGLIVMERYHRLKAAGTCVTCGAAPATPGPRGGTLHCDRCRATTAHKRRVEQGLCLRCGQLPAAPGPRGGTSYCEPCRERYRQIDRERYQRRRGQTT